MIYDRLMPVDPSLTCSGWALFAVEGSVLLGVGKIKSLASSYSLSERLKDLQQKIEALIEHTELSSNDVLICEAPTTMRDPKAAFKVEQVRGIFETVARSRQIHVPGRINPRSVQAEIMGLRGKQLPRTEVKQIASSLVQHLYGKALSKIGFCSALSDLKRNQDIVDAILLGSLGLTRIGTSTLSELSLAELVGQGSTKRWVGRARA